jgi:hypothetical protein
MIILLSTFRQHAHLWCVRVVAWYVTVVLMSKPYASTSTPLPLHAIGSTVVVEIAETCRTSLAVHPLVCVCVCRFMHV